MRVIYEKKYVVPDISLLTTEEGKNEEKNKMLFDALPEYFTHQSENNNLRFELPALDSGMLAIFRPDPDVAGSLLYPILFSDMLAGSTHFTERRDWDCYQLVYTYSGSAILMAEGRTYTILPGSFFLIDCRPEHAFYANSPEGWGYRFIHFSGPAMKYLYKEATARSNCFPAMEKSQSKKLFDRLFTLAEENPADFDIYANLLLTRLINELYLQSPFARPSELPEWLSVVQSHIVNNFNKDITIDELAELSYLSRGRFSHKFREAMGVSPIEYQYRLRISRAKEYLRLTDLSVQEISERIGFHDVQNFQVKFRKTVGMSPTDYRRDTKEID